MRILNILSQTPDFTGSGKYIQAIRKCAAGKGHDNFLVAGIQGNFFLDSSIISPEDTKASKGAVEMLYAGKLSRAKGVPWLLQSLDRIKHLPWILHLTGTSSGREKEECLSLAEKLNNRVIVHGSLNHRKLAALMRKTHIFILPSFFEGLPLVLMEALASGCRIITTSLPGTREVLGDSKNRMVDLVELPMLETIDSPYERDMAHLRERLSRVIEKVVKKTIENRQPDMEAALKITENYTWEKVFSRIEKVYEKTFKDF